MRDEFWHEKWATNEIGFDQANPNPLLRRHFSILDLPLGSCIFVPLCGKSIDMMWLVQQGYHIVGGELSSIACKAFFEEQGIPVTVTQIEHFTQYHSPQVTLLAGDLFYLSREVLGEVHAVYDRAALVALPQATRQRYADFLTQLFQPNIPMFLISFTYDQNSMQGPPFSVDSNEVRSLYGANFEIQLLSDEAVKIASHLQVKGLTRASEQVYCLHPSAQGYST